ncbi:MAG: methylmalonyl-CoA epimerase [Planctomycetes bacterium]|nr:methylmalonyl-CoA epimerase [Planctomycetota bacterium]MBV21536.1 methylmalonyl-CoA epimerase [Planctomycetaceae bacterium]MDP6385266.1 methylmalonyl-CoA epimerase [Planctomycetota bacterium]MDP6740426.1 methylmalonyl-CoA epimerase [Planctomycetota bacterium]MDP6937799.1 methylmalonyl-CoA epimerase [Planctomycetota bacterium]
MAAPEPHPKPQSVAAPEALRGVVQGLHHVAIAVRSLADAQEFYAEALGLDMGEPEYVAEQGVNVVVAQAGGTRIEFVEPVDGESPVARFLDNRGPGLHHLAWKVHSVEEALQQLAARNVRLIDKAPRPGSHNTTIAFVHPSATGGVLMELVQEPD